MHLWQAWIGVLQAILQILAVHGGLGTGLAIIVLTAAVRVTLLPLTWSLAHRAAVRQATMARLAPALQRIRERYADDPRAQMQHTLDLHRQHGLGVADGKTLLGAFLQMPVIYGLYQALRTGVGREPFLWVRDLGRPDTILGILAALSTAIAIAVAPHLSEHARLIIVLVPAILCCFAALHVSSGVALYWITSNLLGAVQTLALRQAMRRTGTD
jgi:YidC/Oxa1 family membrane protein insertase